jgi:hypothetical protein
VAGVLLAACDEQEDSDSSFADGSVIQPASGAPGGMVATPGGALNTEWTFTTSARRPRRF